MKKANLTISVSAVSWICRGSGIPATLARYLTVSDRRIFWSAILGMIGIPLECLCYFAVYRLIVQKSEKYAHTYRTGILGCLIFGGCGVHVPCCAAIYFLKKMVGYSPDTAYELTVEFMLYFLVPATVLFLVFFLILIVTQIKAFAKGLTPLPKWAWVFSVLFGLLMCVGLWNQSTGFSANAWRKILSASAKKVWLQL